MDIGAWILGIAFLLFGVVLLKACHDGAENRAYRNSPEYRKQLEQNRKMWAESDRRAEKRAEALRKKYPSPYQYEYEPEYTYINSWGVVNPHHSYTVKEYHKMRRDPDYVPPFPVPYYQIDAQYKASR